MEDPNPLVAAGFDRLREVGIEVEVASAYAAEAAKLNESFVHFMRTGLPLVTLKAALTLDGKISAPEDNYGWITSETARAHVQEVRHAHDAIVTGIGTVLSDDCRLTDRTGRERARPLMRIVLDSQLRIPLTSHMVAECHDDLTVVCTSAAPAGRRETLESAGVRVLTIDGADSRPDIYSVIRWLATSDYRSLMIEAGSQVNWAFLATGAVDRILFYYAPKILGGLKSLGRRQGRAPRRRDLFRNVIIDRQRFVVEACGQDSADVHRVIRSSAWPPASHTADARLTVGCGRCGGYPGGFSIAVNGVYSCGRSAVRSFRPMSLETFTAAPR
jgi:diaminohydroxyphosphoribosylaminopyrimidine deaminase/5-amino-6-(5-phosphoribosylamino)uracil reductase